MFSTFLCQLSIDEVAKKTCSKDCLLHVLSISPADEKSIECRYNRKVEPMLGGPSRGGVMHLKDVDNLTVAVLRCLRQDKCLSPCNAFEANGMGSLAEVLNTQ